MKEGGRGGYEYFPEDGNYLFTMAQWYPRLCVYSDFQGWQNHQFTGRGEFALTFGNFKVQMTVPADHVVGSTGECLNYAANLTPDETGIGNWSFEQFTTAIRKGKYKGLEGSRPLLPPMPWQMYKSMTDEDLKAVFTYLNSLPPINNLVPSPIPPNALLSLSK